METPVTLKYPNGRSLETCIGFNLKLGDQFEDKEHDLFGREGFEGIIVQIAEIEKALGIYDLSKFTPNGT